MNQMLDEWIAKSRTQDGLFDLERGAVQSIHASKDGKIEWVTLANGKVLAHVTSAMGYPAYYPVHPVKIAHPVKAVLMDLDGTTVHSEHFWIWIIEKTVASLIGDPSFRLSEEDEPHVAGHSVSEHLQYCIRKYSPSKTVEEARSWYYQHTRHEMAEIMAGRGKPGAFTPSPGLKPFLLALKERNIKIALVTSGLYEKAWPEILDAFRTLELGDPAEFYDAVITAGYAMGTGQPGTLGELSLKPHPWLYAEAARVGLGIPFEERHHVVGIEDSGAGVVAVRLAGFAAISMAGGTIASSGLRSLCAHHVEQFDDVLKLLDPA